MEKLRCSKCQTSFGRKDHLHDHEKICKNKNGNIYKCSFCGKGFSKKNNCSRHENIHTHKIPDSSISCSKSTSQKTIDKITKGKTFECKRCGQKFKGTDAFDKHKAECRKDSPPTQSISNLNHLPTTSSNKEPGKRPISDGGNSQKKAKTRKKIKCRLCGSESADYKELYRHKMQVYSKLF
jgi:KRAB domain-containing zinc finger protein